MSNVMLSRFKSASPKLRLLLGLWIALEVASLPLAAGFAWAFGIPSLGQASDSQLVAERLETDIPGVSHFVVTHSEAFDITIENGVDIVEVKIEDAHQKAETVSGCAQLTSLAARVVKTVEAPPAPDHPIGTLFVTVTHNTDQTPEIGFESLADVPQAIPCQIG